MPSNTIRCMFVGHFGVGKTTLVKALMGRDRRNTESTDGIEISVGNCLYDRDTWQWHTKGVQMEDILALENIIQIHFWDFAGQRIYYTTHQANMSSRCLYFLVFNMSMGLNGEVDDEGLETDQGYRRLVVDYMEFWVESIQTYAPSDKQGYPKILVIGTHCDEVENIAKLKQEILNHFKPQIESEMMIVRDEFFVNALEMNEDTIQRLRDAVIELGTQYPEFNEKIPISWIRLQKRLSKLKTEGIHIMSLEKIKCLQESKGMLNEEINLFLSFLHHLGYILYYTEGTLQENVILNPQWVIDAMKCIITCKPFDKFLKKNEMRTTGKLKISSMIQTWKNKSNGQFFPHRDHLQAVFEKLDLICVSPNYDSKGHDAIRDYYFVPCMVITKPPDKLSGLPESVQTAIASENLITITYHFRNIMPPAIFHRLVCAALSLWSVLIPHLYDGFVITKSGRSNLILFTRKNKRIDVSFVHMEELGKIQIDLCRAVRQFVTESLNRIIALYKVSIKGNEEDFYTMTYNDFAKKTGLCANQYEVVGGIKGCHADCEGLKGEDKGKSIDGLCMKRIAESLPPSQIISVAAHLNLSTKLESIQYEFKELGPTVHYIMLLDVWKKTGSPTVGHLQEKLLDSEGFHVHSLCQAIHGEDELCTFFDPAFQINKVNEEILDAVSDCVSRTYIELGLELGLHLDEILRLRLEQSSIIKLVRQMLRIWLKKNTTDATIAWLGRALLNSECDISTLKSFEGMMPKETLAEKIKSMLFK